MGAPASARRRWAAWLRRYGPAELLAALTALAGYALMRRTGSDAAAAYAAALADNFGSYGLLLAREVRGDARAARGRGERYGAPGLGGTVRALAVELGPAAALDATVVRAGPHRGRGRRRGRRRRRAARQGRRR